MAKPKKVTGQLGPLPESPHRLTREIHFIISDAGSAIAPP